MIKAKAVKMNRVTFLVLDEADRMFDLGFGTIHSLFFFHSTFSLAEFVVAIFVCRSSSIHLFFDKKLNFFELITIADDKNTFRTTSSFHRWTNTS
jgi:hypothetical protein